MRTLAIVPLMLLMSLSATSVFAEAPASVRDKPLYVSETFREVLKRVSRRDRESQAILEVKAKDDSPMKGSGLLFRLEKFQYQNEVLVTLYRNFKTGDDVFEQYRLRMDGAMRLELLNLQRFAETQAAAAKKLQEDRSKQVETATQGKLKAGMTTAEVIRILGKPLPKQGPEPLRAQADMTTSMEYPGMTLIFELGKLQRVETPQQRVPLKS